MNDFIGKHEAGYDLLVGERGEGLSGGERQAVTLARALLSNPNILMLDEPTNSMDKQSEKQFITRMKGIVADKTLVVVTHKTSLLTLVDRIIIVEDGMIIADDTKEKILINWWVKMQQQDNNQNDVNFIYSLYNYANETPSRVSQVAFFMITAFVTFAIFWAAIAEIDELARGDGKVIPSDKIQTIQSLDGGVLEELFVKQGQFVKKGDKLLKVDTTRFRASFEENEQEYLSLLAIKTRLEAEVNLDLDKKIPQLEFPKEVVEDRSEYNIVEQAVFESRARELKSSLNVFRTQLGQKKQELKEIQSTVTRLKKSLVLIGKQKKNYERLVKAKIKSKYDLLDREKEYTETEGELNAARLSIPRSKLAIEEAQSKMDEKLNSFKAESAKELQKTAGLVNKIQAKLVGEQDKVDKTEVVSPVDGIVKQININTVGGVVQQGTDLIEIVPDSNTLLVEAKIDPKDIAFINPSQKAIVKITAYDFSIYGGLDAEIVEISADSIVDKESKDGKSFYRVVVKTDRNYLERKGEKLPIIPGMVASVDIITGKKTILDFILKPILKVQQNALHER